MTDEEVMSDTPEYIPVRPDMHDDGMLEFMLKHAHSGAHTELIILQGIYND
jgi:hypothetical protein